MARHPSPAVPAERRDARYGLFGLICLLLAALWAGVGYHSYSERQQALDAARRDVANLSRALSEHVLGTLRLLDQTLEALIRRYQRDAEHFDASQVFAEGGVFRGTAFLITVVGRDGRVLQSSVGPSAVGVDLGDRAHIRAHMERDTGRMFVGRPVYGKASKRWGLRLTRRLSLPDGSFAGVMVVSFDPATLSDFFATIDLGHDGIVGVVGTDGVVRARRAGGNTAVGQDVSGNPLFAKVAAAPAGVVEERSGIDGLIRIVGFRAVPEYGLIVTVGRSLDEVLGEHRDRWIVLAALVVSWILLAAGWALMRQIERVRDSELALRRQERELIQARETAELHSEAKSRFLANMSHELRTPLNAILGYSEVIRDGLFGPIGQPRYAEYARDIHQSGALLLSLINDILDLSKIEAGQHELKPEPLDLAELARAAAQMLRLRAGGRQIELSSAVEPAARMLSADRRALHQVVLNLLTNAVKFTEPGGRVGLSARSLGEHIEIGVSDTGIGIAPARLQRLFEPFQQRDAALASGHDGFGLGLSICKALVEAMGGGIVVDSELGRGTTITVRLPRGSMVAAAA